MDGAALFSAGQGGARKKSAGRGGAGAGQGKKICRAGRGKKAHKSTDSKCVIQIYKTVIGSSGTYLPDVIAEC